MKITANERILFHPNLEVCIQLEYRISTIIECDLIKKINDIFCKKVRLQSCRSVENRFRLKEV